MEVEKAFKKLLVKNPFYGLFCLSLPKNITRSVPTLCVSKQGINCQLNINPDFWEQHTDDEQIALLTHELSHICLQHMFMTDSFPDNKLFNIAADAEVNSYIENLPKSAVTAQFLSEQTGISISSGLGTKKYYEILSQQQQQQQQATQNTQKPCNGGGGANNQTQNNSQSPSEAQEPLPWEEESDKEEPQSHEKGQTPSPQEEQSENKEQTNEQYPKPFSDATPMDDHSTWKEFQNMPEATKQLMQNNVNSILKSTAEQIEKMRGYIPENLVEIIEKLRERKPEVFNWKAYFRRLIGSIYDVNIRSTRRKESKRFEGSAGIQHRKKVSMMVAVDTSGSVSTKELQDFFSEINYIYKAGAKVTIVECDAVINHIVEYDGRTIPEIKGRGGTDFNPPVEYYIKNRKEYASLIYFTDGYADIPKKYPSKMVWVITSNGCHQDYPGKVVYIPKENSES